jgi:predicted phosphodiesterase
MKICFISDTHNIHGMMFHEIPECDLLIHCGDCMNSGNIFEVPDFLTWFNTLDQAKHKVYIAGNHDFAYQNFEEQIMEHLVDYDHIKYLQDESTVIEGVKIFGSPRTPKFGHWSFIHKSPMTKFRCSW